MDEVFGVVLTQAKASACCGMSPSSLFHAAFQDVLPDGVTLIVSRLPILGLGQTPLLGILGRIFTAREANCSRSPLVYRPGCEVCRFTSGPGPTCMMSMSIDQHRMRNHQPLSNTPPQTRAIRTVKRGVCLLLLALLPLASFPRSRAGRLRVRARKAHRCSSQSQHLLMPQFCETFYPFMSGTFLASFDAPSAQCRDASDQPVLTTSQTKRSQFLSKPPHSSRSGRDILARGRRRRGHRSRSASARPRAGPASNFVEQALRGVESSSKSLGDVSVH